MNNDKLERKVELERKTNETDISLSMNIDGCGKYSIDTGIGFFNHMLEQLSRHSGIDLELKAAGDTEVDCHHTVEDVGIIIGKALRQCLGDNSSIRRYGSSMLPMDEALCMTTVDICGRANLIFNCSFDKEKVGDMDTDTVEEFFRALCSNAFITLHINLMYGSNTHHMIECIFKAVARSIREAVSIDARGGILSTKGCL